MKTRYKRYLVLEDLPIQIFLKSFTKDQYLKTQLCIYLLKFHWGKDTKVVIPQKTRDFILISCYYKSQLRYAVKSLCLCCDTPKRPSGQTTMRMPVVYLIIIRIWAFEGKRSSRTTSQAVGGEVDPVLFITVRSSLLPRGTRDYLYHLHRYLDLSEAWQLFA